VTPSQNSVHHDDDANRADHCQRHWHTYSCWQAAGTLHWQTPSPTRWRSPNELERVTFWIAFVCVCRWCHRWRVAELSLKSLTGTARPQAESRWQLQAQPQAAAAGEAAAPVPGGTGTASSRWQLQVERRDSEPSLSHCTVARSLTRSRWHWHRQWHCQWHAGAQAASAGGGSQCFEFELNLNFRVRLKF